MKNGFFKALFASIISAVLLYYLFINWKNHNQGKYPDSLNKLFIMESEGVFPFVTFDRLGRKLDLSEFKGRKVIIHFWASWCNPCLREMPALVKLIQESKGKVILLAISEDTLKEDMDSFMNSFPEMLKLEEGSYSYIIKDNNGELMRLYGTDKLPESYIVGSDFRLLKKFSGEGDWSGSFSKSEYFK